MEGKGDGGQGQAAVISAGTHADFYQYDKGTSLMVE